MPARITTYIHCWGEDAKDDPPITCRRTDPVGRPIYPPTFTVSVGDAHIFLTPVQLETLHAAISQFVPDLRSGMTGERTE